MNKQAQYNKKMKSLLYWNSKNTTITINCRTYACAKLAILIQKNLNKIEQELIRI